MPNLRSEICYRLGFVPWEQPESEGTAHLYELLAGYEKASSLEARALDLGCGRGHHALELARLGWSTVGVDLSARAVQAAKERARGVTLGVRFEQGDATDLPATIEGPFELVIDVGCLHSLSKKSRSAYAEQVNRVTAVGSELLISAFSLPFSFDGKLTEVELAELLPGWHLDRVERARVSDLPFLIRFLAPYFYQLSRKS